MASVDESADLRLLVECSPDGVVVLHDGIVIYVNAAFAAFLGQTRSALVGSKFVGLLNEAYREPMTTWLSTSADEAKRDSSEYGFVRADGARVILQLTPIRLTSFAGQLARGFIARDFSQAKQTQADLLLADRMMTVGTLAAGVAHEINNPISYVIGNLHFALSVLTQTGLPRDVELREVRTALEEALSGAERIGRIVSNFQAFSRKDPTSTKSLSLPSIVETALTAAYIEIRRRARLIRDLRATPPVIGNEARLGQVILNLVLNAVQALPEHQTDVNTIEVCTYEENGQAVFRITDNGPGIAPQVLNHVFEQFFTTKPIGIGTGLGLSIAHSIVRQLGGTIEVDSTLGEGTTFTVRLPPRTPPADEEGADAGRTTYVPAQAGRILVVDDESLIISAFKRVLREFEVTTALSGREAVNILSKDPNFSLIFCDLYMPGLSGMDVHKWVQKSFPGLEDRIVFMTGGAQDAVSQAFLDRLPNRRMNKPFNPEDIQRLVRDL